MHVHLFTVHGPQVQITLEEVFSSVSNAVNVHMYNLDVQSALHHRFTCTCIYVISTLVMYIHT